MEEIKNNPNLDPQTKEIYLQGRIFIYKFIIFLIVVFSYTFWNLYFVPKLADINQLSVKYDNLVLKQNELDNAKKEITNIQIYMSEIESRKNLFENCLNSNNCISQYNIINMFLKDKTVECTTVEACFKLNTGLQDEIIPQLELVRVILSLSKLEIEKMDFNQKLVLTSIYDFLLRNKVNQNNGNINIISFGFPTLLNKDLQLYKLPINLSIDFDNKDFLFSFLENIEQKINLIYPTYYTIESLNYDILKYKDKQSVNILLNLYFYK